MIQLTISGHKFPSTVITNFFWTWASPVGAPTARQVLSLRRFHSLPLRQKILTRSRLFRRRGHVSIQRIARHLPADFPIFTLLVKTRFHLLFAVGGGLRNRVVLDDQVQACLITWPSRLQFLSCNPSSREYRYNRIPKTTCMSDLRTVCTTRYI